MSDGDVVQAFEKLAQDPSAFTYPIEYFKPSARGAG
jgi:hypothetical protein